MALGGTSRNTSLIILASSGEDWSGEPSSCRRMVATSAGSRATVNSVHAIAVAIGSLLDMNKMFACATSSSSLKAPRSYSPTLLPTPDSTPSLLLEPWRLSAISSRSRRSTTKPCCTSACRTSARSLSWVLATRRYSKSCWISMPICS